MTCCENIVPIVPWRREPLYPRMQMNHLAGHFITCLIRVEPAIDVVIARTVLQASRDRAGPQKWRCRSGLAIMQSS